MRVQSIISCSSEFKIKLRGIIMSLPSSFSASLGNVVCRNATENFSDTSDDGTCQAASNLADEPQIFASPVQKMWLEDLKTIPLR